MKIEFFILRTSPRARIILSENMQNIIRELHNQTIAISACWLVYLEANTTYTSNISIEKFLLLYCIGLASVTLIFGQLPYYSAHDIS